MNRMYWSFNFIRELSGCCTSILAMNRIKTFVFFDLETTGLPHLENNKTKITEMTLVAVQSDHLFSGVLPRVQNKLNLCFNPGKLISYDSEKITGLSNFILEHQKQFSASTVQMINTFLKHNPQPVCLVAHNGNKFDFPIFKTHIQRTGLELMDDVLCMDSLDAFRTLHREESKPSSSIDDELLPLEFQDGFDELLCKTLDEYENSSASPIQRALEIQKVNETTPKKPKNSLSIDAVDSALESKIGVTKRSIMDSTEITPSTKKVKRCNSRKQLNFGVSFKLADVFERLTSTKAVGAHRAEADVAMLVNCAATLGEKFVTWANENARNFSEVPAMIPGQSLGK